MRKKTEDRKPTTRHQLKAIDSFLLELSTLPENLTKAHLQRIVEFQRSKELHELLEERVDKTNAEMIVSRLVVLAGIAYHVNCDKRDISAISGLIIRLSDKFGLDLKSIVKRYT